ncbi:hypothetical protein PNOK_0928000 [Pyrrhoderma noxium]|uniref:Uncharacterized protein n=1 Tax=Pyrrhoderma noxium TaxID=2282107 RepID=A0A286U7G1_9AGAM|nr:hypothetical protein PNOK_0928000 [Pyrrhoderma noxium]
MDFKSKSSPGSEPSLTPYYTRAHTRTSLTPIYTLQLKHKYNRTEPPYTKTRQSIYPHNPFNSKLITITQITYYHRNPPSTIQSLILVLTHIHVQYSILDTHTET